MARQAEETFKSKQNSEGQEPVYMASGTSDKFAKDRLLSSRRFTPTQTDVLSVLLKDGEKYTIAEAEKTLSDFLNGGAE